jgi:hypothetical protein
VVKVPTFSSKGVILFVSVTSKSFTCIPIVPIISPKSSIVFGLVFMNFSIPKAFSLTTFFVNKTPIFFIFFRD